jgi:hypothetical protein
MTGFAAADINTTGPGSTNRVSVHKTNRFTQTNNNDVDIRNRNNQRATSGDATVRFNTHGGDATSGNASNDNSTDASVSISNDSSAGLGGGGFWGGGGAGSIDTTGPGSRNTITSTTNNSVRVTNNNDVDINNSNTQTARTGDATVRYNTFGGDATSGDATNTNSSSFSVDISNN